MPASLRSDSNSMLFDVAHFPPERSPIFHRNARPFSAEYAVVGAVTYSPGVNLVHDPILQVPLERPHLLDLNQDQYEQRRVELIRIELELPLPESVEIIEE
jgi:hypothetical protein